MELILLILQAVILVALLANILQNIKNQKTNKVTFLQRLQDLNNLIVGNQEETQHKQGQLFESITESIQDKLNHQLHEVEERANGMLSEVQQTNNQFLYRLEKQTTSKLNGIVDDFSQKLDSEISMDIQKINEWILFVDSLNTTEEKIEALESGINKYPYSKELVMKYFHIVQPLVSSGNKLVYKRALERMNKVARIYLDNCDVADYNDAIELYNGVLDLGKQFMEDSYDKRVQITKHQLIELEKKIGETEESPSTSKEELIEQLEEIENKLDKQFIQKVNTLKVEYQKLSKRIINVLTQENDEDIKKRYNLNAISELQLLHSKIKMNAKDFRSGRIPEIARVLGKWETSYFTPQTNVYYQFVYKDIFDNLDPEEKPKLTQQVLEMDKKKVS